MKSYWAMIIWLPNPWCLSFFCFTCLLLYHFSNLFSSSKELSNTQKIPMKKILCHLQFYFENPWTNISGRKREHIFTAGIKRLPKVLWQLCAIDCKTLAKKWWWLLAFCLWLIEEPESDQGCDQGLSNFHFQPGQLESLLLGLISLCVTVISGINAAARHKHQFRELTRQES